MKIDSEIRRPMRPEPGARFRSLRAIAVWVVWGLAACGGVETGGTGASISSGSISGFASIIVNGIEFDEASAKVVDDSGGALDSGVLKLGMSVRVQSDTVDASKLTATATQIEVVTDLLGPLDVSDLEHHTLGVLGQPVQITPTTLFAAAFPGGQADIAPAQQLQIYALFDPVSGRYVARYVAPGAEAPAFYKLRGPVSFESLPEGSFRVGPDVLLLPLGKTRADFGLEDAGIYRLQLNTVRERSGRWVLRAATLDRPRPNSGDAVQLDDVIGLFISLADFDMAGLKFDASSASLSPDGYQPQRGDRVSVTGVYSGSKVIVQTLKLQGRSDDAFGYGTAGSFTVGGAVDSLDTVNKTFVIRGVTISYANAPTFKGGIESDLKVQVPLEVSGQRSNGNSSVLQATSITFVTPP
jgi:hypothetical protein